MKKFLLIGLIVIFLLLDWAALDDITTGNEPSFFGEYLMLTVSIPVLVFSGYLLYHGKRPRQKPK